MRRDYELLVTCLVKYCKEDSQTCTCILSAHSVEQYFGQFACMYPTGRACALRVPYTTQYGRDVTEAGHGTTACARAHQYPRKNWNEVLDVGTLLLKDDNGVRVQSIVSKYKDDIMNINFQILREWVQGDGVPCTWDDLICILKKCSSTLAVDIEERL